MRRSSRGLLVISIPEGVELTFPLAGGISRFFAWLIDLLVILTLILAASRLLAVLATFGGSWIQAFTVIAYFTLSTGYGIFCEWRWRGQTVGKRLFGLRVMDANGLHLTFAQVVIRNLVRVVDLLPAAYLVGAASAILTEHSQRLGDLAASTVVVRESGLRPWMVPAIDVKYNSLAAFPHIVARLRHSISAPLLGVAAAALLRRDRLLPNARVELFDEIRGQLASIASFPPSAIEFLTSEQYVRNVVAAISSRR